MALADPGTPPLSRPSSTFVLLFLILSLMIFFFVNFDFDFFVKGVVFVNVVNVWTTLWSCSAPADPRQEGRVYFSFP
jgi:hypothetical protein|nr:MAG TPA: hypothetical protein [Caudoviricetes sp.]